MNNQIKFRQLRIALGLTITEASQVFNVDPRSVRRWESDNCPDSVLNELITLTEKLEEEVKKSLKSGKLKVELANKAKQGFPFYGLTKLKNYIFRRAWIELNLYKK